MQGYVGKNNNKSHTRKNVAQGTSGATNQENVGPRQHRTSQTNRDLGAFPAWRLIIFTICIPTDSAVIHARFRLKIKGPFSTEWVKLGNESWHVALKNPEGNCGMGSKLDPIPQFP